MAMIVMVVVVAIMAARLRLRGFTYVHHTDCGE